MAKKQLVAHEGTISGIISDAMSELQTLADEMRSWADNMEEKLSHTEKYDRVSEAADTLEGLDEPDTPDSLKDTIIKWQSYPPAKRQSRADRRSEAVADLQRVVEELEELISNNPESCDEAEGLRDDLQQIIDDAEGVEFPGMYG